jgi:hypothetical protein
MREYAMLFALVFIGLAGGQSAGSGVPKDELLPPVKIVASGRPINADLGHAAPFFADFDGDGVKDLLVGQFSDGKLAIYRNIGTNEEPKFDKKDWFEGRVPAS